MARDHALRWLPDAYRDLREARDWYEEHDTGLGVERVTAFWETVDAIDRGPALPRLLDTPTGHAIRRWHFGNSWPCSVVYMFEDDTIVFIAVAHDRRLTIWWIGRLDQS